MRKENKIDPGLLGRAMSGLVLRVLVAAYIVYMAWKVLSGTLDGTSPIPEWGAWAIFSAFALAAAVFCAFAVKQFLLLRKEAEIKSAVQTENKNPDSKDSQGSDSNE
ncbi:MAG: hypothetical protein EOM51_00775 [Clostridia bacterium]|nr:hypothetical protein [Clostridia bacterium]